MHIISSRYEKKPQIASDVVCAGAVRVGEDFLRDIQHQQPDFNLNVSASSFLAKIATQIAANATVKSNQVPVIKLIAELAGNFEQHIVDPQKLPHNELIEMCQANAAGIVGAMQTHVDGYTIIVNPVGRGM